MQRVCPKCNTLVTGEGAFCPSCGEPLPAAVQLDKQPQSSSVQFNAGQNAAPQSDAQPGYSVPQSNTIPNYGSSSAQYSAAVQPTNNSEMTLGQWVGTVILTTWFGIISLILCIVWGVSDTTPIAKKRYCQAMLIIQAISIVVSIIFTIVFFSIMSAAIPEIVEAIDDAMATGSSVQYYY